MKHYLEQPRWGPFQLPPGHYEGDFVAPGLFRVQHEGRTLDIRYTPVTLNQEGKDMNENDTNEAVKTIRKNLNKTKRVAEGTIIKWDSRSEKAGRWGGRVFTYVAIYAAGRWFITGDGLFYGKNVFTYDEFFRTVLNRDEVENIAVASDWETVEV
jgi:hypothetical protein